jgi:GNAT superfamily N-acetyltransferase
MIDATEHDLWARVAAAGWADVAIGFEDFLLTLGRVNSHRACAHCFLATYQDESIAAGAICLCESVALLAGASTIPKWRGKGAQTALLEARLRYAAKSGCDIAMIVTQPGSASQRNAERQGFRVAYTRTKWRRPRTLV